MRRFNAWLEGLSNWRFVAAVAAIMLCAMAIGDCVIVLITGRGNLSFDVGYSVVFVVVFTAVFAGRRWK